MAATARTEAPVQRLLGRLDAVKETGPGRWIARCPSHEDRHPSLSIRETTDGVVLLRCWAGCGAAEVVGAVGLALRDLFDRPLPDRPALRPRERWVLADVLTCLAHDALVMAIVAEDMARGRVLDDAARDALAAIGSRFRAAADAVTT